MVIAKKYGSKLIDHPLPVTINNKTQQARLPYPVTMADFTLVAELAARENIG
ncbi:MAG: hypothetical protein ABIA75_10780 [Candidatus Neomarinimicrobiota bacterium]